MNSAASFQVVMPPMPEIGRSRVSSSRAISATMLSAISRCIDCLSQGSSTEGHRESPSCLQGYLRNVLKGIADVQPHSESPITASELTADKEKPERSPPPDNAKEDVS